jgi:hypothetical protein
MRAILNFNSEPSLKIGDDTPCQLALCGAHLQAMVILGERGRKISAVFTKHLSQTYEISEDTANLLRYALDSQDSTELEEKIGGYGGINELDAMVDRYIKTRKEFELLTKSANGKGIGSMSIPFNSGTLKIRRLVFSAPHDGVLHAFLFNIKIKDLHIQYFKVLASPNDLLRLKNDPIGEVTQHISNRFAIVEECIKINGKYYTLSSRASATNAEVVTMRGNAVVTKSTRIHKMPYQYKSDIITAIKNDVPVAALTALK